MSKEKVYDNRWDDEVEERLKPALEAILPFPKEERWSVFRKAFKSDKEYNEVMNLLMKAHSESFYKEMERGSFREEYKPLAWVEAIKITVEQFKVDGIKFIVKLNRNFSNCSYREKNREQFKEHTGGMSEKNKSVEVKLGYYIGVYDCKEKELRKCCEYLNYEELRQDIREKIKKSDSDCTDAILDKVERIRNSRPSSIYFESEDGEYNSLEIKIMENKNSDFGKNPESLSLMSENKAEAQQLIKQILQTAQNRLSELNRVEDRECYRTFFTRDILKQLKLQYKEKDTLEKDEKEEKYCDDNSNEEAECKIVRCRFKRRQNQNGKQEPAGVYEIYEELRKYEYCLMENLFQNDYIGIAIEQQPESLDELYGIYYNLLQKEFTFSDMVISEMLRVPKQTLSRHKKYYYERFIGEIRRHEF